MHKKIILLISLLVTTWSFGCEQKLTPSTDGSCILGNTEEEEPIFCNFDQPELPPELVQTQKPSALLRFLAKGYPALEWCVELKKSFVSRLVAVKNRLKNWFILRRRDVSRR